MRRFAFLAPVFCLALTLSVVVSPIPAHADTYKLFNLGSDVYQHPYGITDSGTVVVNGTCPGTTFPTAYSCYRTYVDGMQTAIAGTAPSLPFDNGVACDPSGLPIQRYTGRCNGGYVAYDSVNPFPYGAFYAGSASNVSLITNDIVSYVLLNRVGDVLYDDISQEETFEAVVTPEPSTLALLGTGCLGVAGAFRRRFKRA